MSACNVVCRFCGNAFCGDPRFPICEACGRGHIVVRAGVVLEQPSPIQLATVREVNLAAVLPAVPEP